MGNIIKKYFRKSVFLFTYHFYVKPHIKTISSVKFSGFKFIVHPSVFNPRYSVSSKVFAEHIKSSESLVGKSVLDMGCGSGIVSVFAASKGADCTACDINPMAVKSAYENAAANGFSTKIKVVESDLFGSPVLKGCKFDIIFFNPPYYRGMPKNNFEAAYKGGKTYEVIHRFLKEAKRYLNNKGYICIIISSDMGIDELENIINSYGYLVKIDAEIHKIFETFYIVHIVV